MKRRNEVTQEPGRMQGELRNINILRIAREGDPEKEIRGEKNCQRESTHQVLIFLPPVSDSPESFKKRKKIKI